MSRRRCGKEAEPLQVEWGKHIDHKESIAQLATGKFDTVTLIHNETSTGVMNPLPEICCTLAKYPDVALVLDTVSSFSAVPIAMDALGIDVMLTGAQKALALPPGFSLFSVSEKAFARAEKQTRSRLLFRFSRIQKTAERIYDPEHAQHRPHFRAAIKARRNLRGNLAERVLLVTPGPTRWFTTGCASEDSNFFAEENFRSITLTCVKNNRGIDVAKLVRDLREKHHLVIDGGYGKIKGQTFRLSNMGDETEETVSHLLACLDSCLG